MKFPFDFMYLNVEREVAMFPSNPIGITRATNNLAHPAPICPILYGGGDFQEIRSDVSNPFNF